MRALASFIVVLGSLGSTAALSQSDCTLIEDPKARLSCFDKKSPPKSAKKAAAPSDRFAAAKKAMLRKLTDPSSAQWGEFYQVQGDGGAPLVCGAVNSKNQMGGYAGMTGFTYTAANDQAILLFSGRSDPDAGIAITLYRQYCLSDPRSDKRAIPGAYIPP